MTTKQSNWHNEDHEAGKPFVASSTQIYGSGVTSSRSVKATRADDPTKRPRVAAPFTRVFPTSDGGIKAVTIKPRRSSKRATTRLIGDPAPESPNLFRF